MNTRAFAKIVAIGSTLGLLATSALPQVVKKIPYSAPEVTVIVSGSLYYQDIIPAYDDPIAGVVIHFISNGEDGSSNEARVLKGTTYYKTEPDTLTFTSNSATDTLYVFAIDPIRTNSPLNPLMGKYTISVNGVEDSITSANVLYFLECVSTEVGNQPEVGLPPHFRLHQNYPNPFNPATTIKYEIPMQESVEIMIFNSTGQLVKTITPGIQPPGSHSTTWDGRDEQGIRVPTGSFFYQVKVGNSMQAKKMLLLK